MDFLVILFFSWRLEQEFNLSFTDEELLQLFKVSHIIHILDAKRSNAPLSDESHFLNACKNSFASVRDNKENDINIVCFYH